MTYEVDLTTKRYRSPKVHISVWGKPRLIVAETTAQVFERDLTPPRKLIGTGRAYCSWNDNFSKVTGRRLAIARAVAGLRRETRAQVWALVLHRPAG